MTAHAAAGAQAEQGDARHQRHGESGLATKLLEVAAACAQAPCVRRRNVDKKWLSLRSSCKGIVCTSTSLGE
eukprot:819310-Pyramimonas_sp.AAC.1